MSDSLYGVKPTGYVRKPLSVTLAEIEQLHVTEFGPGVIQTPQSPLGQLNGLMADLITELHELAEDVYQSFDIDQAEGTRLDTLAKLRDMRRGDSELDPSFRQAITNQGNARIDVQDIVRAVRSIPGVTYARVFLNDGNETDENRMPPGHICVAVLGGDDEAIAETIREYVVPGISTYGNQYVSTNVDGFCRSVAILRPIVVPVTLTVYVRIGRDAQNCPPPAIVSIRDILVSALNSELINGEDINHYKVRKTVEAMFPAVEVVRIEASRDEEATGNVDIAFIEIAELSSLTTTIVEGE